MRILLAEDTRDKASKIITFLVNSCDVSRDDITHAVSVIDAKKALLEKTYDLLILDILLPVRIEDEPKSESSVALLNDINTIRKLNRPKYIVGLTAHEDTLRIVEQKFRERTWAVLHYNPTTSDWLTSIKNCIEYIKKANDDDKSEEYETDLCVLTALADPEEQAVLNLPWSWEAPEPADKTLFIRRGKFNDELGNSNSVILAHAPRMGMVSTALTASRLISKYKPRYIVMTGICATYEGKANLGDILVADPSWDYQSGKRVRANEKSSFEIDSHQISLPRFLVAQLEQLKDNYAVWTQIKNSWPAEKPSSELCMKIGPVASGSAVLDDQQAMLEIKVQQRKILGVEMEIYGLYAAAKAAKGPRPTAFALKSACDFGNGTKNDNFQKYAAYTSAQALYYFCKTSFASIKDEAGKS